MLKRGAPPRVVPDVRDAAAKSASALLSAAAPELFIDGEPSVAAVEGSSGCSQQPSQSSNDFARRLIRQFARGKSFRNRMLYIRMCDSIIREAPLHVFTEFFMRPLLWLTLDPVKNVRLCWATVILPHLRKVGRLGQQRMVLAAAVRLRSTLDREVHRVLEEAKLPDVSEAEIAELPDPETDLDDSDGGEMTGQEGETGSSSECGNVQVRESSDQNELLKAEDAVEPSPQELAKKAGLRDPQEIRSVVKKLTAEIVEAWQRNRAAKLRGQVDCGQIQRAKVDPSVVGFLPVGVSKQRGKLGQMVSPFMLFTPKGLQSFATETGVAGGKLLPERPLELVWQAAKIKKSEVGSDGLPTDEYFQRRTAIYQKGQVQRRYIPTEEIGGAILSYRTQAPVKYIESRKFYCCAYTKAVVETESYQFLQNLCQDGFNLLLLGPDGHSCLERERRMDESEVKQALCNAYNDPSKQFGHERVLLAMLTQQCPWADAPDPTGEMALCPR
eukprot:s612_g29.t3